MKAFSIDADGESRIILVIDSDDGTLKSDAPTTSSASHIFFGLKHTQMTSFIY